MAQPRTDVPVSFRFSPRARERLRELSADLGIPQVVLLELGVELVGRLTRRDLVRLAGDRLRLAARKARKNASTP